MALNSLSTTKQETQSAGGVVLLPALGLSTVAQGDVIAETGAQVLTHCPVAELDSAGIMTVTMRSHMS
jgi:hypothetical protein